ncbi:MAG: hypothetical protein JAY84_00815 [Candidatus Thiodiazotropha taylori]|nr:hypothetical protein [Candidatus Thiodiazotropha taylori]
MNNFDKWLSRVTSISQVVIMVLALLGFFYTVVPLYQRELVNEEFARTRLEHLEVKNSLEASRAELSEQLEKIELLKLQKNDLAVDLNGIRTAINKAVAERESAVSALRVIERKYQNTERELEKTEQSLNHNHMLRVLQSAKWFSSVWSLMEDCNPYTTTGRTSEEQKRTTPDCTAYGLIKSALQKISQPNAIDPAGDKLDAPRELIVQIVTKSEELLELNKLQLNSIVSEKRKLEVINWFFEMLRKNVGV